MSIDSAGWLDWAVVKRGVPDKVYVVTNAAQGICCHSMEGNGVPSRFWDTTKGADGSYVANAQASVMFMNMKDGTFYQCYPVTASPWTSGNAVANCSLWPVESEGVAGEPLNAAQVTNMLKLAHEFEVRTGKRATRAGTSLNDGKTIWEHREVWNWATTNAGPTACPSGRYAPFYSALEALGSTPAAPSVKPLTLEQRVAKLEADHLALNAAVLARAGAFADVFGALAEGAVLAHAAAMAAADPAKVPGS
jgi:hypothetical protein